MARRIGAIYCALAISLGLFISGRLLTLAAAPLWWQLALTIGQVVGAFGALVLSISLRWRGE